MKKIYILDQKLKKLQSQKKNLSSIENMSILQFAKYKNLLKKENKINDKIYKFKLLKKEVNFLYDINTKSWIANPKINSRTYYKLEQNAAYKKDLTLYKIGVLDKKPVHPIVQNFNSFVEPFLNGICSIYQNSKKSINKKIISKFTFIKNLKEKYNFFISNTLPHNINNLAINTAKIGIKGYKQLEADCRFVRNSIKSKNSYLYFKNIITEANKQLSITDAKQSFRDSLRINPEDLVPINNLNSQNTIKSISHSNQRNIIKNHPEYIL